MKRLVTMSLALFLLIPSTALGQDRMEQRFEDARVAWDEGQYIHSMELMVEILESPGGDRLLPQIALLTGDLFKVTEIATDGSQVDLSPDGSFASYAVTVNGRTETQVVPLPRDPMRQVIGYDVSELTFSPIPGQAAYFRIEETRELRRTREELMAIDRTADRAAWSTAQQRVRALEQEIRKAFIYDLTDDEILMELKEEGIRIQSFSFSPDGRVLYTVTSRSDDASRTGIHAYQVGNSRSPATPEHLIDEEGTISGLTAVKGGRYLLYSIRTRGAASSGGQRQQGGGQGAGTICLMDLDTGEVQRFQGSDAIVSDDGSMLVINVGSRTVEGQVENSLHVKPLTGSSGEKALTTWGAIRSMAISPDGENLAFQMMPDKDWEVYVLPLTGGGETLRVTRNLQHDINPVFLDDSTLLVIRGEGRHRRSYLYNLDNLVETRLFHNNTVRTFCPEYSWVPSADGRRILISSERDGDTISPERGIYLVDLDRQVTKDEVLDRLRTNLESERILRRRGEQMFAPIFQEVKELTARVSTSRMYNYQKALFDFDTKYIGTPGNQKAADWIFKTFASFGYEPELQWFEVAPRRGGTDTIRTPNVLAVLPGTENPEIHYLMSSHFDSNARGAGADDNSTAIAVLLETARILADHPLPCSIIFAAFTGEEAGLLGSREFARQAVEEGLIVKGALNNDMIGWSGDHRLDNTIRFSNYGIRDVQHTGAILFSDLITYDAHYYKSTDAHALYEAFGDVIGGLGSYHVLGNPHYHQTHDNLETINQELVTESCRSLVASMMLLASSPSMVEGLELVRMDAGNSAEISWNQNPEINITEYHIAWGPEGESPRHDMVVTSTRATLENAPVGTIVQVKAMNDRGHLGWDWAKLVIIGTP
ncbi:M28 family peptidase [Candidatus Zixiibacteriota bacterium]